MASSDEEGEIVPDCVTNYHFVDCKDEPISFSILPLQWGEDEIPNDSSTQIFLRGSVDSGLQQIYKKVISWKFELSFVLPEIYVLSKDKAWIKLKKPRKSFEETIKPILITVHCLHFVKKNPEASRNAIWNQLLKTFSFHEIEPSESDLLKHIPLINEAAARDKVITRSEYLAALLLEMPGKSKAFREDFHVPKRFKFIVDTPDDDGANNDDYGDESDENELFDSVCALCDNGGDLLCCEGSCTRSFHATVEAGTDTSCESLGYTDAQVEAIQNFLCKNCQYQQHQCFVCGILGSSNKSSGAEVFRCVSATCGHFYHPKCVVKLLHPWDETQAAEVQKKIAAGESFTCPAHKCCTCKQGEDKQVYDLQFAICRRCPKAYHRKCLPGNILFEGNHNKNIYHRAWDGLLPNRILIYCMDHEIIPELATPERNHILFPGVSGEEKQQRLELLSVKKKLVVENRNRKVVAETSALSASVTERTAVKMRKRVEEYAAVIVGDSAKKLEKVSSCPGSESQAGDVTMKPLRVNSMSVQARVCKPSTIDKCKSPLRNDHSLASVRSHTVKPKKQNFPKGTTTKKVAAMPLMKKAGNRQPLVNAEMEKGIVELMKRSASSFKTEEFIKKQKMLSGSAYSVRSMVDKTITLGKVEASVKAVRAALKKLEEGCTTEDAKAVCEPEVLNQIVRWKSNLGVYLAPFLHGMCYTSFGRHFTKVDKLKEIVDRLHWYVQDGDMVVDFCCGSNDFSCLMKEKLEQMGKRCLFRNYDLIQSKNNFNFEKRDWMTVGIEELPAGSQLIMGLNPPFGVQAFRANQFIDKALKFKPKLLILIVPRETKRLNEKVPPYDLIWEDSEILSGKSFYLPGSLDVHDKQMEQWNLEPPPLYLWSHPDWTAKHKAIAHSCGHLSKEQEGIPAESKDSATVVSNYLMEEKHDCFDDFSSIMNGCSDISRILDDVPEDCDNIVSEVGGRATLPHEPMGCYFDDHWNNLSSFYLNKNETSQMGKLGSELCRNKRHFECEKYRAFETHPEAYTARQGFQDPQTSLPGHFECEQYRAFETHPEAYMGRQGFQDLQTSLPPHRAVYGNVVSNAMGNGSGQIMNGVPFLSSGSNRWSTGASFGLSGGSADSSSARGTAENSNGWLDD